MQGFLPGLAYPPAFRLTLDGRRPMLHGSYLLSIELDGRRSEHSRVFFTFAPPLDTMHDTYDHQTKPRVLYLGAPKHTSRSIRNEYAESFDIDVSGGPCISVGLRGIRNQSKGKEKKKD